MSRKASPGRVATVTALRAPRPPLAAGKKGGTAGLVPVPLVDGFFVTPDGPATPRRVGPDAVEWHSLMCRCRKR